MVLFSLTFHLPYNLLEKSHKKGLLRINIQIFLRVALLKFTNFSTAFLIVVATRENFREMTLRSTLNAWDHNNATYAFYFNVLLLSCGE